MLAKRRQQLRKLAKVLVNSRYRMALLRAGVGAAIEHEALLKSLNFATIIDIGANRGQFALVARHCFQNARIISFEPLAAPARRFKAAIGDDPHITLHRVAIGPSTGTATMHVAAEDDSSSLLPITALQQSLSGTREVTTEAVQVECLACRIKADDLQPPALLKIDVQGYELSVLQGCEDLLQRFSHVYVECSFVELYAGQALAAEVIRHLDERGFCLAGVYNIQYGPRGQAIQADLLCSKQQTQDEADRPPHARASRHTGLLQ